MLSLFLILLFLVLLFIGSASRSIRRRQEEQRRQQELAERQRQGSDEPVSPFAGMPFGSLFDQLFSMGGARSLAFDPETGQWIDITDQQHLYDDPQPQGDGQSTSSKPAPSPAGHEHPKRTTRPRSASMSNPLSGLFGAGGDGSGEFDIQPADQLATFADVGGMESLKQEVRNTVGLMLQHPDDAERYGIEWNGILLHGPPGVGKTFFARAIAGEYGMNLMHVSTGDLVSGVVGGSARNIDKAFDTALKNLPCLLFFDEFDSVAQRRDNNPDQESRRTVNQLLTSLEAHRDERRLLVMAATNSIENLDPAVIRPGRFDRHIRIDLPDAAARREIFNTELRDRPTDPNIVMDELVSRTEGMTPAGIEKIVEIAALEVFRAAQESGKDLKLGTQDLLSAIDRYGGQDRPTVEHWTWDSLILAPEIKAQLQQLQAVIEDPESARRFGVDPPTGLLLAGPPGTGKTTVAKVLAAQARCSFYPISGADVISKWVGESERNIRQLFERARENRPAIVFIDEIDAIAARRGGIESTDSHVNQLLAEIDGVSGQRGVFIIGATNRPDQLDPALLRGGRLSRTIVLRLPDQQGRLAMLRLHSARMPTVGVDLEQLSRDSESMAPADLKALCQEAALAAMARTSTEKVPANDSVPSITQADFSEALSRLKASKRSTNAGEPLVS
ncbi:MAG: transitional endoplasmic reticulum ATPase [Actinomycetota bacterium]|nr:transitional endoplasmic reticulum ATPase [Actinomycetota bacterium]